MTPQPAMPSPAAPTVGSDVYCINCGYNLRTLAIDRACPECNYPVRESLLSDAKLAWLRKVRRGLTLLVLWNMLGTLLMLLPFANTALMVGLFSVNRLAFPLLFVCETIAVFMATRPSAYLPSAALRTLGPAARVAAVLVLTYVLLLFFGWFALVRGLGGSPLVHSLSIQLFPVSQWLMLSYAYLLLRGFGINSRSWWVLAMTLVALSVALGGTHSYLVNQQLPKVGRPPLNPLLIHAVYFSLLAANIAAYVASTIFYYGCRRSLSRLTSSRDPVAAGPAAA